MDEDSGASHVLGLLAALIVCGLYVAIVFRARAAFEALIRGSATGTIVAALRAAIARAWLAIALTAVAALFLFFVLDCLWDCCPTITARQRLSACCFSCSCATG
jgi:hypothetical protein